MSRVEFSLLWSDIFMSSAVVLKFFRPQNGNNLFLKVADHQLKWHAQNK